MTIHATPELILADTKASSDESSAMSQSYNAFLLAVSVFDWRAAEFLRTETMAHAEAMMDAIMRANQRMEVLRSAG